MTGIEAVILAGGLGTRLRQAVPHLPKPMAPLNGRPFLEHQMRYWLAQGVRRFILSVGYKWEAIQDHFGTSFEGAALDYAVETSPKGTGGGLLLALAMAQQARPTLVLNGDTFCDLDLARFSGFHAQRGAAVSMALFRVEDNTRYTGVQVDAGGRITRLQVEEEGPQLVNGGAYLFGPAVLAGLPFRAGDNVSLETGILQGLLYAGSPVFGYPAEGSFIDIGIPSDYHRAEAHFRKH